VDLFYNAFDATWGDVILHTCIIIITVIKTNTLVLSGTSYTAEYQATNHSKYS